MQKQSKKPRFVSSRPLGPVELFFLRPPFDLTETLNVLRQDRGGRWTVEFFLNSFEAEAQEAISKLFAKHPILAEMGYSDKTWEALLGLKRDIEARDLDDVESIPMPDFTRILGGIQVLSSAHLLRDHITSKNPSEAAIETMQLMFSAMWANLLDKVIDGIDRQLSRHKGGRASKKRFGILRAIEEVLKQAKKDMSVQELWRYFERNHCGEDNQYVIESPVYYEVWFYLDPTGHDQLIQSEAQRSDKGITKSTFRRYVSEVKKSRLRPVDPIHSWGHSDKNKGLADIG